MFLPLTFKQKLVLMIIENISRLSKKLHPILKLIDFSKKISKFVNSIKPILLIKYFKILPLKGFHMNPQYNLDIKSFRLNIILILGENSLDLNLPQEEYLSVQEANNHPKEKPILKNTIFNMERLRKPKILKQNISTLKPKLISN